MNSLKFGLGLTVGIVVGRSVVKLFHQDDPNTMGIAATQLSRVDVARVAGETTANLTEAAMERRFRQLTGIEDSFTTPF